MNCSFRGIFCRVLKNHQHCLQGTYPKLRKEKVLLPLPKKKFRAVFQKIQFPIDIFILLPYNAIY